MNLLQYFVTLIRVSSLFIKSITRSFIKNMKVFLIFRFFYEIILTGHVALDHVQHFTRVKLAASGQPPTAAKNINKLKEF